MTRHLERGTRLVVASHNPGKVVEIRELVAPFGMSVASASELGLAEPEETGSTFAANAALKAEAAAQASGLPALSDDSGLEVEALGGEPGIYSARWAGEAKDFWVAMRRVADEVRQRGGWGDPGPRATSPARSASPGQTAPQRSLKEKFTAISSGRRAGAGVSAMIRCSSPTAKR